MTSTIGRVPVFSFGKAEVESWRVADGELAAAGTSVCNLVIRIPIAEHPMVQSGEICLKDIPCGTTILDTVFDVQATMSGKLLHVAPVGGLVYCGDELFRIIS
jgi:hypothetical protein